METGRRIEHWDTIEIQKEPRGAFNFGFIMTIIIVIKI